jgi:hypothetical protein
MSEHEFERTPATFDMLYEAVTATPRGRWFLDEFAKRNRAADTEQLLCELARLTDTRSGVAQDDWVRSLRLEVEALQGLIDAARGDFATLRPAEDEPSAPDDLSALAAGIERASRDIRTAGAQLLDLVKRLRDGETDDELSLVIEDAAATLFLAASLEEISGRRAKSVVEVLAALDERLKELISRLGPVDDPEVEAGRANPPKRPRAKPVVAKKAKAVAPADDKTEGTSKRDDSNVFSLARENADEGLHGDFSQERLDALLR